MAKRVYVKKGDVYCIEIRGKYKLFFHYLGNDISCLGGAVIRVFKERYPMDYNPDIKQIIKGEVMFYAHAFIRDGIDAGVWYKVGNSKDFDLEKLGEIWFCNTNHSRYIQDITPALDIFVNEDENWWIWRYGSDHIRIDLPKVKLEERIFTGSVYPYKYIMDYAEYGYYKNTAVEYEVIKRVPHEYADSYVRRERFGIEYLYHFKGSHVIREIIRGNGKLVRLSVDCPSNGIFSLNPMEFGEINWENGDFRTAEEFDNIWNSIHE